MGKYPGVSLVRDADGGVSENVVTRSENGAIMTRNGLDLEFGYLLETGMGELRFTSATTYLIESGGDVYFSGPKQNQIGGPGTPKWRSQFTVNYSIDDLSISWTIDAIASTAEDSVLNTDTGNPADFYQEYSNHNTSYVTHNLNVKYDLGNYGVATIGARNLLDKEIVRDDDGIWVNDTLYNAGHIGRELFAGYTISF
jgi:iron complex outermembrane receptor protein